MDKYSTENNMLAMTNEKESNSKRAEYNHKNEVDKIKCSKNLNYNTTY